MMRGVRKKWKGVKLIICLFLVAGLFTSLTQGTKNAYAQEVFILELVLDTRTGKIQNVKALPVNSRVPKQDIVFQYSLSPTATEFRTAQTILHQLEAHTSFIERLPIVYNYGSPGCIKIETTAGVQRICW